MGRLHLLVTLAACSPATTPGARPHDMSLAGHEEAARAEERKAAEHAARFDPKAEDSHLRCGSIDHPPICWTVTENPTVWQLEAAEEHRRHAAAHRAASVALRNAEARACVGISDADRDTSPFERVDDIARVDELRGDDASLAGVIVTFRPRPGLTPDRLQRLLDCHAARSAVLGHTGMPNCPLALAGTKARVKSGLVVVIEAGTPAVAREVLARMRRAVAAAH